MTDERAEAPPLPAGTLPLVDAALRLGRSYHATRDAVLRAELVGGRTPDRRWFVTEESLEAALQRRRHAAVAA